MGWLQTARLAGSLLGALALGTLLFLAKDRFHQKDLAEKAARCESAAISASEPLKDCGSNVQARVMADRHSILCQAALLPELRPETRHDANQECDAGSRRLIAQLDARADEVIALTAELSQVREDTGAAIARAEARGRAEQTRRNNAQNVVAAQPRGPDGSITCDAACLRQLAN
ncbi:hypothetical protein [Novosphingobium naphthalenivorans]|uniref:hypothetical protein n=1 Tax=Novosphingobium naphthalenivorans TaxID=273168 RepID=UPI000831CFD1|nr:hypothetical protein [Novosphingobium naphthalenivorans]